MAFEQELSEHQISSPYAVGDQSADRNESGRFGLLNSRQLKAMLLSGALVFGNYLAEKVASADPVSTISPVAVSQELPSANLDDSQVNSNQVNTYIYNATKAWEPYVTNNGQVLNSLNPTGYGDGYGVGAILMADVMLQTSARNNNDLGLEQTGANIITGTDDLNAITGPFNFLADDLLLRDGQQGYFAPGVWDQLRSAVTDIASRVTETEQGCIADKNLYCNWRLVWSAGASALLASKVQAEQQTGNSSSADLSNNIMKNLNMALAHDGPRVNSIFGSGVARELSDPLSEPLSYEIFSSALLDIISQQDPSIITPAIRTMMRAADNYALDMMAPDGQLSVAGRSLDQSWVEAAAADLGAHMAIEDPAHASEWRSFAERAFSYLRNAYPAGPNGIVPIVPGLLENNWNDNIMDSYAYENQYAGLTLWFLNDALNYWPKANSLRSPIPADHSGMVVNDLYSSGLAWGRSGNVWWDLSGRATSADPRYYQGLVDIKIDGANGWQDLMALRPEHTNLSTAWQISLPNGQRATPRFWNLHGNGHHVVLNGDYYSNENGNKVAPATWSLTTIKDGVKVDMSKPYNSELHTTLWLPVNKIGMSAVKASVQPQSCIFTASGQACPTKLNWSKDNYAELELGP